PLNHVGAALAALGALAAATLRLWRLEGERWQLVAGPPAAGDAPRAPRGLEGDTASWLALPEFPGLFLEIVAPSGPRRDETARHALTVVQRLLESGRETAALTGELAARYEEIDLLYSIGELLGRSHPVEEVASVVLREVCAVVGARRAGLRLHDESRQLLHTVATLGTEPGVVPEDVAIDDADAVVARAFRSGRIETGMQPDWVPGEIVAVPISYATSGQPSRVVGTLALADRAGGGGFTRDETKLIAAVATQIGAALENARLVSRDTERQRLEQELRLAHDLQVRLMPTPSVLRGDADVAVRSEAAASVGGDFYTFSRLGRGRVGTMLGDVASHGLSAALIAAQVLAAAGIHANATTPPDEMLTLLRDSLADELEKTEMYLTIFYGILDPTAGRLVYASAGHPHAFRVPRLGRAERLDPTAPPLGLVEAGRFGRRMVPWHFADDLLVVFTDGLQDQVNEAGERFGEGRILERVEQDRKRTPRELTDRVFQDVAEFGGTIADDRTLLVLRM
ncbi:MAG: PP2C family protein-serine/threonine phosphatase, partial [Gemmatimonadales bacterium]